MPATPTTSAVLATLQGYAAWALVRMGDDDTVLAVGGSRSEVASLLDVPLEHGSPDEGRTADRLLAIPFRQVTERGFEAHDDGTPLVVVDIGFERHLSLDETLAAIADDGIEFLDRGGFESDDEEYAALVEAIIRDEIGQGEGANLVIGRHYRAQVDAWDAGKALTVFKRLCERERGAYWTFCFFTGDRYLIGASPERHVSVHGGDVRMNPISGTCRCTAATSG
jgi:2-amino-4-deoxychorismate synthase